MDAYNRYTNLGKKILPILLLSVVEAENFSGHPRISGFRKPFIYRYWV